jgi:uncharacterized cupredoxin-like copper-binding protein
MGGPRSGGAAPVRPLRTVATFGVAALVLLISGTALAAPIASAAHRGMPVEWATVVRPTAGPGAITFNVSMTDTPAFQPAYLVNVSAGENVTVNLHNNGTQPHSFTLSRNGTGTIPTTLTPDQLYQYFAKNGSYANVSVAPGQSAVAKFTLAADASGSLEFVSIVPYQFQAGMRGFLNVTAVATGPGERLNESATDQLRFVPNVLAVNATSFPVTVDVLVTDTGSFSHTWTLDSTPNGSLSTSNFSSYLAAHAPAANVALNGGQSVWANFTLTKKGIYEYICTVPGHFLAGMNGSLYVGVPPPAPPTLPSTSIVLEGVLFGAAAIFVLGLLLALATSLLGRSRPRSASPSPPERKY